jgi:hypothetical protein
MPACPYGLSFRIQWVSAKRVFAPMTDGGWFTLHRSKGYEDGLIQLGANPVFILGRKVLTFHKNAASIQASDVGTGGFLCNH